MNKSFQIRLYLLLCLFIITISIKAQEKKRYNILIIQLDDLAFGDLGFQGSADVKTPNIDSLASESLVFENAFSTSPVCSPARASLLTGKHPNEIGILGVLRSQHDTLEIINNHKNIAQYLKQIGYYTGLVGKWHLGIPINCQPQNVGFDYFYGCLSGMVDYYTHVGRGGMDGLHNLFENGREVFDDRYFTTLITDKSIEFINRQNRTPFFLMVNYTAPHAPLQSDKLKIDSELSDRDIYIRMLQAVDQGIKHIVDTLKKKGDWKNTIVIFTNDHGWSTRNSKSRKIAINKGLSSGKYYLKDGGIRVPLLLKYPNQEHDTIITHVTHADVLPTLLNIIDHPNKKDQFYGRDISSQIYEGQDMNRYLYWSFKDKFTGHQTSIRYKEWKYIREDDVEQLYNTRIDKAESYNLINLFPNISVWLKIRSTLFFNQVPYLEWRS